MYCAVIVCTVYFLQLAAHWVSLYQHHQNHVSNSVCYNVTMTTVSRGSRKFSVALGDHTITDVVHRSPKPCYVVCECAWLEVRLCLLCAVAVCVNG